MTSLAGKILLADNDVAAAFAVRLVLEGEGYEVYVAKDADGAELIASQQHIDVAILDVRLTDDNDRFDRSGIELAQKLDDSLCKIMITGFDKWEYGDQLPENVRHFRKQNNPGKLLELIEDMFLNVIRLNRELKIDSGSVDTAQLMAPVKLYSTKVSGVDGANYLELKYLLQRLFLMERKVVLRRLPPGRSGAGVVRVDRYFEKNMQGTPVVVKFGEPSMIGKELRSYSEYVEPYSGQSTTHLIGPMGRTQRLAGIVFMFIGYTRESSVKNLSYVFRHPKKYDNSLLKNAIEHLFNRGCRLWYGGKRRWSESSRVKDLVSNYQEELGLKQGRSELYRTVAEIVGEQTGKLDFEIGGDCLRVQISDRKRSLLLPNPVYFLDDAKALFPKTSYIAITHGDLNAFNVFVDETARTWMIDFYRTGWGSALRDVTELESVFKFSLIRTMNIKALVKFEQSLLSAEKLSDPIELKGAANTNEMRRAMLAIRAIRDSADKIAEHPDNMLEYYAGLFFYALKVMTLQGSAHISSKRRPIVQRHALLSAALIADKLQKAAQGE